MWIGPVLTFLYVCLCNKRKCNKKYIGVLYSVCHPIVSGTETCSRIFNNQSYAHKLSLPLHMYNSGSITQQLYPRTQFYLQQTDLFLASAHFPKWSLLLLGVEVGVYLYRTNLLRTGEKTKYAKPRCEWEHLSCPSFHPLPL